MSEKDIQERREARETISKIFDKVSEVKDGFHSLNTQVAVIASDIAHMKENGCPVLKEEIKVLDEKVDTVDKKHEDNYDKIDKWIGGGKILLWVLSSFGGLALFLKWFLFKKGG